MSESGHLGSSGEHTRLRDYLGNALGVDPDLALPETEGLDEIPEITDEEVFPRLASGRLGRYALIGMLGEGGMGEVYGILDEDLGRPLAAKVIRGRVDPRTARKFVQEARITGQLQHPNIVPVHELGVAGESCLYFTMKQVEGETLADQLERMGRGGAGPTLVRLLQIFLKACDAISFAHSRGVIHRDLKPANIMVGRFGEVLVMDWGLAKPLERKADLALEVAPERFEGLVGEAHRTRSGIVVGTPAYMPPEQAAGEHDAVGPTADVYALGAILYQVLTLQVPYRGDTHADVVGQVLEGPPPPPRERAPDRRIPWELEAVVRRAMDREPGQRYPDVRALQADVERFLEGGMLSAARYTALQRTRKWVRRHRVRATAALALALAVVLTGWASRSMWLTHRDRRRAARWARDARAAHDARHWREALSAGERSLALAEDPSLAELVEQARAHLADERRRAVAALRERRLHETLAPIARRIEATRPFFYIARIDIRRPLREIEQAVGELGQLATGSELGRFAPLWHLMGIGWRMLGDDLQAEHCLHRAVELQPDDPAIAYELGQIYLERALSMRVVTRAAGTEQVALRDQIAAQYSRQALAQLRRAAAWKPATTHDGQLARASLAYARGDAEAVRQQCRAAIDTAAEPLGVEAFWLLLALVERGPARLEACDRAIALKPHFGWAYFVRGIAQHEPRRQISDYTLALDSQPRMVYALHNRALARHASGDPQGALSDLDRALNLRPDLLLTRYQRAVMRARADRRPEAIADLDVVIRHRPGLASAVLLRGSLRLATGDVEHALTDLDRGLELDPRSPQGHFNRAVVHLRRRQWAAALSDLDRCLALSPSDAVAHHERALLRFRKGDTAGALADLDQAEALGRRVSDLFGHRAEVHQARGQLAAAIADAGRAVELEPADADRWRFRAELRRQAGDFAGGIADCTKALERAPDHAETLRVRAMLRKASRDFEGALADYDRAHRLAPREALTLLGRGDVKLFLQREADALADYTAALAIDDTLADAYARRGYLHLNADRPQTAAKDLERAVALAPSLWHAWANLGRARGRQRQTTSAREAYAKALGVAPESQRARIRAELAALR